MCDYFFLDLQNKKHRDCIKFKWSVGFYYLQKQNVNFYYFISCTTFFFFFLLTNSPRFTCVHFYFTNKIKVLHAIPSTSKRPLRN